MEFEKMVFSPIEVNTYILWDETGECAIIDCGCYTGDEFEKLSSFIKKKNLRPVMLLNTHLHLDHVFGNRFILEEYDLLTRACEREEANLKDAPLHAGLFGLDMPEAPGIGAFIDHGDIIHFGNTEMQCISVPGHTAGSLAFYSEKDNIVFTGDALFNGSVGRSDLPGGDHETLISSIKANLLSLDDAVLVYPGHGRETSIGDERKNNTWLR